MVGEEVEIETLQEAYDAFLDDRQNKDKPSTIEHYEITIPTFFDMLDGEPDEIKFADIQPSDIEAFINYLYDDDLEPGTIRTKYYELRPFFTWLWKSHKIDVHPAERIDITDYEGIHHGTNMKSKKSIEARAKGGIIFTERDEVVSMMRHVPKPKTRNRAIIWTLATTGIRNSELVQIRLQDIDEGKKPWKDNYINVITSKRDNAEIRPVPLQESLKTYLKRWKVDRGAMLKSNGTDKLFITNRNSNANGSSGISTKTVNEVVTKAADRAGIQETLYTDGNEYLDPDGNFITKGERKRITTHALRHGFAVHCVRQRENGESGMDIRTLQRVLGHSKIQTTEMYLQFADEEVIEKALLYGMK